MTSKILSQAIASGTLSGNSTDVVVSSNGAIQLAGNNTTDIFIAPNNNVGIGNTTPVDALSVQGSFYQSTNTHTIGTGTYFVSNGYVGIGNTAPTQKIHVQGTGLATSDFRSPLFYDSDNTSYYTDPASTSVLYRLNVSQTSSGVNGLLVNMPTDAETTASGIRIKGYSPAIELMDKDSVQNWYMGIDDNDGNKLIFGRGYGPGQSVTQAITVDTSDNVGIGTASPGYKLDVSGTAQISSGTSQPLKLTTSSAGPWALELYRSDTNFSVKTYNDGAGWYFTPYITAASSVRSPLFYDNDDTGYYCDPNSQSVFNRLNILNGAIAESSGFPWRYFAPGGGTYSGAGTVTGALKVRLPASANNSSGMHKIVIDIYEYNTGYTRTIEIGGYNYSGGSWYNCFAYQTSQYGGDLNIRWGYDATSDCIWIGDTGSTWSYPQVSIRYVTVGYGGGTVDHWRTGWSLSFVTSFDTVENGPVVCAGKQGQILQVKQATITGTFSTTSTSFTDITGISVSITPKSSTSKIFIMVSMYRGCTAAVQTRFRLLRSGTPIYLSDAAGSRSQSSAGCYVGNADVGYHFASVDLKYIDSPSTTSAITYNMQLACQGGETIYIGRTGTDGDGATTMRAPASITVMEIAQ